VSRDTLAAIARAGAVAAPFVLLLAFVLWLGVDVPYQDNWKFLGFLSRVYAGNWTLADVWAQHNDHRVAVAKVVLTGLALLSDWNIRWEMIATFVCAVFLFLGLRQILQPATNGAFLPLMLTAVFVTSLHQWENWLCGFQFHLLFSLTALVWSLALLARSPLGRLRHLVFPVLLALASTFSLGSGLLVWPLGLVLIWSRTVAAKRVRLTGAWAIVSLLAIVAYFVDFEFTPYASRRLTAHDLGPIARTLGRMFGAPVLGPGHPLAPALGFLALALFLVAAWRAWFMEGGREAQRPLVIVGMLAIGNALLIVVGRSVATPTEIVASKHITFTGLIWVPILGLTHSWARSVPARRIRSCQRAWNAAAAVLAIVLLLGQPSGFRAGVEHHRRMQHARELLITGQGDPSGYFGLPSIDMVAMGVGRTELTRLRLSLFRDAELAARAGANEVSGPVLEVVRDSERRLTVHVGNGAPRGFVALFVSSPGIDPVLIHSGVCDEAGTARISVPVPDNTRGATISFQALTIRPPGIIVASQAVPLGL